MDVSVISNDNVQLHKIGMPFNGQISRKFNTYIHSDSVTNDHLWDFLNYLSNKGERRCLIVGDLNVYS